MSLDEELEKRKAQMTAFFEARDKERFGLASRPLELPNFMWKQLDEIAHAMSISTDELIRIWLFAKIKTEE